jgi:transposase InsO family protein
MLATMGRPPSPHEVALWRHQQIEEAFGDDVSAAERGRTLRRLSRTAVRWPSGLTRRISLASLYRWLQAYASGGLEALRPRRRRDRDRHRRELSDTVVVEALRLLSADPEATLTFLVGVLEAKFPDERPLPRSTLQRRLAAHPDYARLRRLRRRRQRRTRFVASAPHRIWHTDAKGPFRVRLLSGVVVLVHVLSVLDDASRAVLAALVTPGPSLAAAVLAFRRAALRWGLPDRLYADRASIFDSHAFRSGLAQLGVHRIRTRARNAPAHGKIEAYHRTLTMWFVKRLPTQGVVDLVHLGQLLDGVLGALYQTHKHRGLGVSPQVALGGRVSPRNVPPTRLVEAFRQPRRLRAHRTTGEVDLAGRTYLVPEELRGQRLTFLLDPAAQAPPVVVHPVSEQPLALRLAAVRPQDCPAALGAPRWAPGPLQALYDNWQGQIRPQAEPGFGLPELYELLARAAGRHVPRDDPEAALVQRAYQDLGPWARAATESACRSLAAELGPQRPLKTYLDALAQRIHTPEPKP